MELKNVSCPLNKKFVADRFLASSLVLAVLRQNFSPEFNFPSAHDEACSEFTSDDSIFMIDLQPWKKLLRKIYKNQHIFSFQYYQSFS